MRRTRRTPDSLSAPASRTTVRAFVTRTLVAVTAATLLSGCMLQFTEPKILLTIKEGYNEREILIPYVLYGSDADAYATWSLSYYDRATTNWVFVERRDVRLPSGTSGVLQLGELPEAQYELVFELLTTRDGSYEPVPYLTHRRTFYVDRVAPHAGSIALSFYDDNGPIGYPTSPYPSYAGAVHMVVTAPPVGVPGVESPNRILYRRNDIAPPVPGENEYEGPIFLWDTTVDSVDVVLVAVDEAGNRSQVRIESWIP